MSFVSYLKNFEFETELENMKSITTTFINSYVESNSKKIRLIDIFVVFNVIILILQTVYMLFNGLDPMNSFLAGIVCNLGTITLLVCLRLHVNPATKLKGNTPEKVYIEFFIASIILYFVCINFIG